MTGFSLIDNFSVFRNKQTKRLKFNKAKANY